MIRRLAMVAIVVLQSLQGATTLRAQNGKATTVIVVRHAEKAAEPASDPPLTPEGAERANDLWLAVKDAGVAAIVTTQLARTHATAAPTAAALSLTPDVVSTTSKSHVQDVVAAVQRHAGTTILVVGHSNTVPDIVAALGAKQPAAICDPEYDNLYVVTIAPDGKASVVHSRFGKPSPVNACAGAK